MHTCLSNPSTTVDSMAQWSQYVKLAKAVGMTALGSTEHGNIFSWYNKKMQAEKEGLKYVHGIEAYVTFSPLISADGKATRESFHCVLLARNHQGFVELNHLASRAYSREDRHFYYYPRMTWQEIAGTSDNVIVTSACLGGILRHPDKAIRDMVVKWFAENKHRCFLEVQHHLDLDQIQHNKALAALASRYHIPLVAGTDTHATDEFNAVCRRVMQSGHNVHFEGEDNFDLTFKDYDQLCYAYRQQGALSEREYMAAIDNTNCINDMISPLEFGDKIKYPQLFDNPSEMFDASIEEKLRQHPELIARHGEAAVRARIEEEKSVFKQRDAETYMLLYKRLVDHNHEHGIFTGPGRGSAAGSIICYLFDITEVDPLEYNLNFARFMSVERTSIPDIDADYYEDDRAKVFDYLLRDKMDSPRIESAQIITYGTIKLRSAIRNIGKALDMPLPEVDEIAKQVVDEAVPDNVRDRYPELFAYVDKIQGVVLTMGRHAAGVVIADVSNDMAGEMGICTSDATPYPITVLDKKEVESLLWVKYDILGLDYVGLINKTCKLAGIPRLTPSTVDVEDDAVWQSLSKDTTGIFQFMKASAQRYVAQIMSPESMAESAKYDASPSRLMRLALASAMLRPGAASVRDTAAKGIYVQYPIPELNDTLRDSMGTLVLQESLMAFLVRFCGYTGGQSDYVRSCVAKKKGTEQLVADIEKGFLEYAPSHYDISHEDAERLIKPFIQTILDSSEYSFSKNHSVPYTFISYECAYLRYHYPLEFVATAIDIFRDDNEYIAGIKEYAASHGIDIAPMQYGKSREYSTVNKADNCVYQSIAPVKHVSQASAAALYEVGQMLPASACHYFCDVVKAAKARDVNERVLRVLISLDFFAAFGGQIELNRIMDMYNQWDKRKTIKTDALMRLFPSDGIYTYLSNGKAGAKQYSIIDKTGFMHCLEDDIRASNFPDIRLQAKLKYQIEYLGYISYASHRPEDRFRLCVLKAEPLVGKHSKKTWAYKIKATSLKNGITQELTVPTNAYAINPVSAGDIITTRPADYYKDKKGYWNLVTYQLGVI